MCASFVCNVLNREKMNTSVFYVGYTYVFVCDNLHSEFSFCNFCIVHIITTVCIEYVNQWMDGVISSGWLQKQFKYYLRYHDNDNF